MKPDINQHLQSMAKALNEIVLPELQDKPFAHEQASLIAASLNLLVEVQEHQFAYVRQELDDMRTLLSAWLEALPADADAGLRQGLRARLAAGDGAGFREQREALAALKLSLRHLMDDCPLPAGSPLAPLLDACIERQLARETAWLRLTGFIPGAEAIPRIAAVLEAQRGAPLK